ncbi:Hypothetical predicted protein [Pelobates cultripes]|uniref:Reverse transcriptase n=1 Tax=Pelobates cultripes TaxID=61616 RepID=A0AAD1W1Y1_PELCU|nr:Hypothetical predicted protein [Pelobates cultripes]
MDCQKQLAIITAQNKQAPSHTLAQQIQTLTDKLTEMHAAKTSYFLLKMKATHYHHSGKANKQLANRLREKLAAAKVAYIQGPDGTKIQNPLDITQEFAKYYSDLYNLGDKPEIPPIQDDNITEFLSHLNLPQINQSHLDLLLQPITLWERNYAKITNSSGEKNDIKYLGLTFTRKTSDMFPTNYTRVWTECLALLRGWGKLFLTWTERIVAIKMTVLPKLQYVFRNLPLKVPQSYFKAIQSTLLQFIWGKGRERVSSKLLSAPIGHGGMAFPNVKYYYQAAVLAPLMNHLTKDNRPQWVTLENLAIKPFLVTNLLWLPNRSRPTIPLIPLQLQLAMQTWDLHRTKFETAHPLSMATPIEAITYCIPIFHATPWKEKGISFLSQAFDPGGLMSFERLNRTYNIPHTSQYSYIQLKSFLHKLNKDNKVESNKQGEPSTWEQISITGKIPPTYKPLSSCYKLILPYQSLSGSTQASQWEMDLQTSITDNQWKTLTSSVRKLVKSASLMEQYQKTIYRWYMVPLRLHKLYPHSSSTCWRCKQEAGSVLRIWWRCPRLIRYWGDVQKLIADTTNVKLSLEPITFLLLDVPKEVPIQSRKLIYHILLTAQKLIARAWKTNGAPNIQHLIQDIDNQAIYETSFSGMRSGSSRLGGAWDQWRTWRTANPQLLV